jgi:ABC-type Mn2+/Zn2+ transport system ATPase subunit
MEMMSEASTMVLDDVRLWPGAAVSHAPAALAVEGLVVRYESTTVLNGVSFALPAGALVGIIGPNGAGKTTLIKAILGLVPVASGSVTLAGQPVLRGSGRIAYIPQRDSVNRRFPATALDVVLMGRYRQVGWLRRPGSRDRAAALAALDQVGLADQRGRSLNELSGGQQQRVFLARALAQEPDVLLLDEPISGVDVPNQEAILAILDELARQGKTLLLTTHDLRCNMNHFSALMALNRRLVALGPAAQVLTPATLAATYGTQVVLHDGTAVTLVG